MIHSIYSVYLLANGHTPAWTSPITFYNLPFQHTLYQVQLLPSGTTYKCTDRPPTWPRSPAPGSRGIWA